MFRKLLALGILAAAAQIHAQAPASNTGPIRIGLMTVDSGPFAFFQSHLIDPVKYAVEQFNAAGGVLGGRKFEVVIQAHAGTPAGALATAQKLVQEGNAPFLTGFNTSSMSLALAPRLAAWNAILIDASTTSDELVSKTCNLNYFHASTTDSMAANLLRSVLKSSGAKTWNLIAPDYAMGHDFNKRFSSVVQELGGTVQTAVFAPLGTADFGSHISQLAAKPADGLAVVVIGADAMAFAKQQKQFGLFPKFKTVVSSNFTNDIVLGAQGDTTVGAWSSTSYSPEMPGPKNAAFVKAWIERFKRPPSYIEADNYQAMEVLKAAIEKAGSSDPTAVRKALAGLKTTTIMGDVEMRAADHLLVRPMALIQVESAGEGKGKMALRRVEPATTVTPPPAMNCE